MIEEQMQSLIETLDIYTSFFLMLIVVCFVAFIVLLVLLVHSIKARRNLKKNRAFLAETITVQEEERRRISQELHDTVSQNIKALLLLEKGCAELLETAPATPSRAAADGGAESVAVLPAIRTQIEKIIALEKQNQSQLRSIIQNLTIPALKDIPFKTVIADLCDQFNKQSGIPCAFFVAPDVDLEQFSTENKHHILRIIQEALNNARVHANPEETSVIIRNAADGADGETGKTVRGGNIRIMIFDDGKGFDPVAGKNGSHGNIPGSTNHFGMSGMEMRAALLGGTLDIQSSAETGTEIRLEIPTGENTNNLTPS